MIIQENALIKQASPKAQSIYTQKYILWVLKLFMYAVALWSEKIIYAVIHHHYHSYASLCLSPNKFTRVRRIFFPLLALVGTSSRCKQSKNEWEEGGAENLCEIENELEMKLI
jgi:hypothetical protein